MKLFSRSRIANEAKTVFAWWPVKIRTVETRPKERLKVINEEIVWLERVGVKYVLQSGNYQGKTYYRLEDI